MAFKDNPVQAGSLPAFPQWRKEAIPEGAHSMTKETEAGNKAMQKLNRGLGYLPGKGHYRICKPLLWGIDSWRSCNFYTNLP